MNEEFHLFDSASAHYDKGRPDYPIIAVTDLIHTLDINRYSKVLDVASGTGKLAKRIAATQASITAYDSSPKMLKFIKQLKLSNIEIVHGDDNHLPFANSGFDAITVGQAMHWFNLEIILPEFQRILKPKGKMGLIWNKRDMKNKLLNKIDTKVEKYRNDSPNWMTADWKKVIDKYHLFTPLFKSEFLWDRKMNRNNIIEGVLSRSYISNLPPSVKQVIRNDINKLISEYFKKIGNDYLIANCSTLIYSGQRI